MKLRRSRQNLIVAGVCGGLAEQFELPSFRLRVVWVLATVLTAFAGVILYIALWYLMPKEQPPFEPAVAQPWRGQ